MLDLGNISHNRIMTFTQGRIAKVKVTVYTWQKIVLGPLHYHYTGSLDGDDTSRNCCSSPWGCCCGVICPVRHVYFIWRPPVIYLPRVAAATYLHVSGEFNVIISRPPLNNPVATRQNIIWRPRDK